MKIIESSLGRNGVESQALLSPDLSDTSKCHYLAFRRSRSSILKRLCDETLLTGRGVTWSFVCARVREPLWNVMRWHYSRGCWVMEGNDAEWFGALLNGWLRWRVKLLQQRLLQQKDLFETITSPALGLRTPRDGRAEIVQYNVFSSDRYDQVNRSFEQRNN